MDNDAVEELLEAFAQRDVETIRSLAERTQIDERNRHGLTVLMLAAAEGDSELVRWILDAGADPDATSHTSVEPGEDADEDDEHPGAASLTLVLRGFASTSQRDPEAAFLGQTALFFAAESGSPETVEQLLAAGARPDVADVDRATPLVAAAAAGDAEILDRLLAAHAAAGLVPRSDALEIAAALGYVDVVRVLVEGGLPVEPTDLRTGMTPLYHAAAAGQADVVELLLQAGASAGSQGFGSSALLAAIAQGHEDVVRQLLGRQEGGEQRVAPRSLLHLAVENGQPGIVDLLAQAGTDVDATDLGNRTPLHIAIDNDQADVAAALVDAGAGVDLVPRPQPGQEHFMAPDSGRTPLILAAAQGRTEIVRLLVVAAADLDRRIDTKELLGSMAPVALEDEGMTALMIAGRDGHLEITQVLVDDGAGLELENAEGETAFAIALRAGKRSTANVIRRAGARTADSGPARLIGALKRGDPVTVASVLASGVDPDSTDRTEDGRTATALILAARVGEAQSIYSLLGAGAAVDARTEGGEPPWGQAALMLASRMGHAEAVQALLKGGADPELHERDSTGAGRTAFMMAATHGHLDVLRIFKRMYDKVDFRSADGMTALTCAAASDRREAVELLLSWGAEVCDEGQSALAAAARNGHLGILDVLLEAGADIDAQTAGGVTALMAAAEAGQLEAVELLIEEGANLHVVDANERSAFSYAIAGEQHAIVRRLEEAGAIQNVRGSG